MPKNIIGSKSPKIVKHWGLHIFSIYSAPPPLFKKRFQAPEGKKKF